MGTRSDPRTVHPDGERIRELRRNHGWSQLDLLNKIVELNDGKELLTLKTIENVEKGKACFYQTIRLVAQAFAMAPGDLACSNSTPRQALSSMTGSAQPASEPKASRFHPEYRVAVNPVDKLRYVWIPAGEFAMGSDDAPHSNERPVHRVKISQGFWLTESPVTGIAFNRYAWKMKRRYLQAAGDNYPAGGISWDEARLYCEWAGGKLPTEAEWEYAARAGCTTDFYGEPDDIAWYDANSNDVLQPIKEKKPNGFGLFDMLGNVWEWCSDWYEQDYYQHCPSIDPQGPSIGDQRIIRGGGYNVDPSQLRLSERGHILPKHRPANVGLRCVLQSLNEEATH